jgi:hypothetical protein
MKIVKVHKILNIGSILLIINSFSYGFTVGDTPFLRNETSDSLPSVTPKFHAFLLESKLRNQALLKFAEHQLPDNVKEWELYRAQVKNEIIKKAGVIINHKLPLNTKETASLPMKGYIIKNISFQVRPEIYATANLFIPSGNGPFPAVINLHAHSGRFDDNDQAVGHSLALNGYVVLSIDPWGAGERTSIHGITEYHGSNLGASFMNIGESLLGVQISDNLRGVDLLSSLTYVDPQNIGATGASGGGNQTMWLAAVDERIKAAVPVVSVGTFESYVMRSNCICELLIDGLTFTEEAGVLALANAIMPCNHKQDDNPTFFTSEMLRSYNNARPVFKMAGHERNISYQLFDLPHGYLKEDREAMLGWFDLHLKGIGTGSPKKESPFTLLTEEELMVFPKGKRDANVLTTVEYCKLRGNELRTVFLNTGSYNNEVKRNELKDILRIREKSMVKNISHYSKSNGWDRMTLETTDNKLIPLLHLAPADPSLGYFILCNPNGKNSILPGLIDEYWKKGSGIVVVDLSGAGEASVYRENQSRRGNVMQNVSRAELWLGETVLGEWVKELNVVTDFLTTDYKAKNISIDGSKEAGLAALFMAATMEKAYLDKIIVREAPISYLFDAREGIDFFSMAIHLPGFLNWGDISLASALTGKNVTFINPVTMSGQTISGDRLKDAQTEFDKIKTICRLPGKTLLINIQ